jgi:glutamyl-tRNA synthetase
MRVRFAPSPTGALHIGGVRTALYNYLLAKKHGGTFILRIEDTDQKRYVPGAEDYIKNALDWCGINPDEGPDQGGDFGPYRQSERKDKYAQYADQLIESGHAYYAFDTPEEIEAMRQAQQAAGNQGAKYGVETRMHMKNSLSLGSAETKAWLDEGKPYTIRLKIPEDEVVSFTDEIREQVRFNSKELDDKVIFKSDGMPTYHLANVVDDHAMQITHVIRGEEWLSSTGHHVYLYRFLGWEDVMPKFAHLPLILSPVGKGKLSKRHGKKFGFPVFPLSWEAESEEDSFIGFKDVGYLPEALVNFLAFLGWNPGTEQEIFSLAELVDAFSLERINKSGARFDIDKAKWFNQQYIHNMSDDELAAAFKSMAVGEGFTITDEFAKMYVGMFKERVQFMPDLISQGKFLLIEELEVFDEKSVRKKWKGNAAEVMSAYVKELALEENFTPDHLEQFSKDFLEKRELGFGSLFPGLRLGLSGSLKGPSVFEMMQLMGKEKTINRLKAAPEIFAKIKAAQNG